MGLIVPSIFSLSPGFDDLVPRGTTWQPTAKMMVYGAIIDLDCKRVFGTEQDTLQRIKDAIHREVSLQQLCTDCLDFAKVTEAVKILCNRYCCRLGGSCGGGSVQLIPVPSVNF